VNSRNARGNDFPPKTGSQKTTKRTRGHPTNLPVFRWPCGRNTSFLSKPFKSEVARFQIPRFALRAALLKAVKPVIFSLVMDV
jgi:hypothetical protein